MVFHRNCLTITRAIKDLRIGDIMVKNTQFQIIPSGNALDTKYINEELSKLRKKSMEACNIASSLQFSELMNKKQNIQIEYGKSFQCFVEDKMKQTMEGYNTNNVAQTRAFVFSKSNFNPVEIYKGERAVSSYRLSNPIIIHNKAYVIYIDDNGDWFIDISLFNRAKQKELGVKRIAFKIVNLHNSVKSILERIIDSTYKKGSGQITYNEKKKRWMFGLAYSFEAEKDESLDPNRILGVDLGIVNTATYSIFDITKGTYDRVPFKESMISGDELRKYRNTIYKKRIQLSRATKWASDNKTGHGYKQRMSDVNKIGDKCAKFRDTYNHKISRYLVNQAVKNKCGIIQMENLSKFSKEQENTMLKEWAYFDLQEKVRYKAEEVGIEFRLINPRYTSKRCSVCGAIHNNNRDCKNNQSEFECVKCGHKMNADVNASRNIALPNIEELIQDELSKSVKEVS